MRLVCSAAIILLLSVTPVKAGLQGHPAAAPHVQPSSSHAHTTSTSHTTNTHTTATHTSAPSHTQHKTAHTTSGTKHTSKHTTSTTGTTSGSTTGGTTTGGTTTGGTTTPTSPIAAKIQSHPKLASKLTGMLPDGMTLDQAAMGFKNQGQFIAALHVSKNLGIPFADLKTEMTGISPTGTTSTAGTPVKTKSLGQAIQALKPAADSETEAQHAETEADADVKTTTTTKTTTPTTTNAPAKTKKH